MHVKKGQHRLMLCNEYAPACDSGSNPRHLESRSEAETASRRLPAGRAQHGNFVESHGGVAKCEVRSASVEVKKSRPFDIRNSAFDTSPVHHFVPECPLL